MAELLYRPVPTPALVVGAAGAVACGVATAVQPLALAAIAAGAVGIAVLLLLPRVVLPSLALALYALLPLDFLPIPDTALTLSPSLVVVVVWMLRLRREEPTLRADADGRLWTAGTVVVGALLLVTSLHGDHLKTGLGWSLAFVVHVLLVAAGLRRERERARALVVTTWAALAGGLGAYAVLEVLVLQANPVLTATTALGGEGVEQVWAVYRATTTLGHPLENAAFFALGGVLALARAVRSGSWAYGAAVLGAVAGLAATGSRGPSAALLVGVLWILAAEAGRVPRRRLLALAGALLLAASAALVVQLGRSGSAEADSSTRYRSATAQQALDEIGSSPWLGVGAGASSVVKAEGGGSLADLSYENGWLEAAISNGVPFLVLLIAAFGLAMVAAWRRRHVAAGAGIAVAVIVMGSSNVLEGSREGLLRFGLLFGLALVPGTSPGQRAIRA